MHTSSSTMENNFLNLTSYGHVLIVEAGQQRDSICLSCRRANQKQMWLQMWTPVGPGVPSLSSWNRDQNIEGARSGRLPLPVYTNGSPSFNEPEEALLELYINSPCTPQTSKHNNENVFHRTTIYSYMSLCMLCTFAKVPLNMIPGCTDFFKGWLFDS